MIISVVSSSGGVGKSTIAMNLSVAWAQQGLKTLLIDYDPDGTSAHWAARRSASEHFQCLSIIDDGELAERIDDLNDAFDMIVIDGRPQLDESATPVVLADLVVLPVNPSAKDLFRLNRLVERVTELTNLVESETGRKIQTRLVVNNFKPRQTLSRQLMTALKTVSMKSASAKLGDRIAYKQALLDGRGVTESSTIARTEMKTLARELLGTLENFEVAS